MDDLSAGDGVVSQPGRRSSGREQTISAGEKRALLSSLPTAEGMIRGDVDRETVVVFDRSGSGFLAKRALGSSVDLSAEIQRNPDRFEGAVLTHNHPKSSSFSYADIETASFAKLAEIRAVGRLFRYSIRRDHGHLDLDYFNNAIAPIFIRVRSEVREKMRQQAQMLSADDLERLETHLVWERVASETDIVYIREEVSTRS